MALVTSKVTRTNSAPAPAAPGSKTISARVVIVAAPPPPDNENDGPTDAPAVPSLETARTASSQSPAEAEIAALVRKTGLLPPIAVLLPRSVIVAAMVPHPKPSIEGKEN